MSIESQIAEVEVSIEDAKEQIERKKALDRLYNNKDFKDLILEGYFVNEASRLVLLKGDLNLPDEAQEHCDKMINGIGCLRSYFQTVHHFGNMAEKGLDDHYSTIQELRTEQLDEGDV